MVRRREVLTSNQSGRKRRAFRYFVDWTKAKVFSSLSLNTRASLSKGTYQFRVKMVDGIFSDPKQFRVR